MPTMGNETLGCGYGVLGEAALAGFFRRRFGADFIFMILFPAIVSSCRL
jgi:hypothetical protein